MTSGNKFFFEEDIEELSTGVTPIEQADFFNGVVGGLGVSGALDSMEPMEAQAKRLEMKDIKNNLVMVEYGIVDKDYVLHITPLHAKRNLTNDTKLRIAIEQTMIALNKIIPFDIQVEIHLPREDYEVKALSFVARGAAVAWNLSTTDLDNLITGEIVPALTTICNKS